MINAQSSTQVLFLHFLKFCGPNYLIELMGDLILNFGSEFPSNLLRRRLNLI